MVEVVALGKRCEADRELRSTGAVECREDGKTRMEVVQKRKGRRLEDGQIQCTMRLPLVS